MTNSSASNGEILLNIIQRLQFTDRSEAESLLLSFIRETFPFLAIKSLELRPQAVSLNSFNGFLLLDDDSRLFFKTHVEQDNVIGEYYNAEMLAQAGYPIIQPLYSSTRSGQQLLIYPVIEDPSVFDVARAIERGQTDDNTAQTLTQAQQDADKALFRLYEATLAEQTALDNESAPIHQLFFHRLTGGRLERFYGDETTMQLQADADQLSLSEIRTVNWTINGLHYTDTLTAIIERSIRLLHPSQSGPSVIGHGDAHNGNVFFSARRDLTYFDPAFAGRHHPLLDLTKPLFHNVFAMWMYFPQEEREALDIRLERNGNTWTVTHNYGLNPLRRMFLHSKVEHTLIPLVRLLRDQGHLRSDWRSYLKAALFCCPFLTLDLKRFPPEISLLGLTMAVQMGAESVNDTSVSANHSEIDHVLDEVELAL